MWIGRDRIAYNTLSHIISTGTDYRERIYENISVTQKFLLYKDFSTSDIPIIISLVTAKHSIYL